MVYKMTPAYYRYLPGFVRRSLEGRSYLRRVIDNTGWVLAERVLRYTIGFLLGVWIARYVGPLDYGLLNYAAAFVGVLAFTSTLGLDSLAVRDMVQNPQARGEILGTLLLMRLAGGVLLIIGAVVGLSILQPGDPRATALIILISLAQFLQAFDSIDCWFQSITSSRFTVLAKAAALLAMSVVRVILILGHAPLIAFAWAILAESTLLALAMLAAYRLSGQRLTSLRAALARAKQLVTGGWPLMLSAAVVAAYSRIDQVMLGQMAGFSEVGAYAVAVRIVEVSYVVPAVIVSSVFPAMIKSRELGRDVFEARIQRLYDVMLWMGVAVALPLSILAPLIVHTVAGNAYAGASPSLALLAWMPVWVFLGLARQKWLVAENALRAAMAIEIAACVLNVLGNLVLIPRHGATGAAMASLLAVAGATLLVAPFSRPIRRSLAMFLVATQAPLRIVRRDRSHR
jgi:O-antigen/teichoic acid export membrane protein